jgi:hypothetical protein
VRREPAGYIVAMMIAVESAHRRRPARGRA